MPKVFAIERAPDGTDLTRSNSPLIYDCSISRLWPGRAGPEPGGLPARARPGSAGADRAQCAGLRPCEVGGVSPHLRHQRHDLTGIYG